MPEPTPPDTQPVPEQKPKRVKLIVDCTITRTEAGAVASGDLYLDHVAKTSIHGPLQRVAEKLGIEVEHILEDQ